MLNTEMLRIHGVRTKQSFSHAQVTDDLLLFRLVFCSSFSHPALSHPLSGCLRIFSRCPSVLFGLDSLHSNILMDITNQRYFRNKLERKWSIGSIRDELPCDWRNYYFKIIYHMFVNENFCFYTIQKDCQFAMSQYELEQRL